jgi:uncharacterized membrane protein
LTVLSVNNDKKNHVKKITTVYGILIFTSNNQFNSVLDLNTTTVSESGKAKKARLKFSLIGITAFTMIAYTVLLFLSKVILTL